MDFIFILNLLLVALGFGFVIFWHELGHFLAAKWAGVRVEQFAVGFGNAVVAWRKGLGARVGTTTPEYEQIRQTDPERAAGISPTEYRLNWIPLGGYVKMYGQEDMVASTTSTEPDHYMNKSVGKRMVIISAGVVMNVILAAILFTVLFFWGYHPPAAMIGTVVPGGPAAEAGLEVGDTILAINDEPQYAWTNVAISAALLRPNEPATFTIQPAGTEDPAARRTVEVTPRSDAGPAGMVGVGIGATPALQGVDPKFVTEDSEALRKLLSPDQLVVGPGEQIVAVQGQPVELDDFYIFNKALADSDGRPIDISVRTLDGQVEQRQVTPRLLAIDENAYAGLLPLIEVLSVSRSSPNVGRLMPGDVIERITVSGTADSVRLPSFDAMRSILSAAGKRGQNVDVVVRRGGATQTLEGLEVTMVNPAEDQYGLGFRPTVDTGPAIIGGIEDGSPAARAGVPAQGRVTAVDGEPVETWFDVHERLQAAVSAGKTTVEVAVASADQEPRSVALDLDEATRQQVSSHEPMAQLQFMFDPELGDAVLLKTELKTRNPLQALWWGVRETRDQIVKLYITLKRVTVDQTVSPRNLTGPVGIFHFGTVLAQKGPDWIVWFLAMISANLAVVNFLPIPILDGGHMVFLASEKVTGRPPSPKVQTAALYTGLLLIVGLVLFVTYNDIQRLLL